MASIEFIVTREIEDDSRDLTLTVDYTYSGYGIDFEVEGDVQLDDDETDCLYAAILENEGAR